MKKRILFVDDEPQELLACQRALESMFAAWELTFVSTGAQALELMARTQYDAIVSDMRMPEMDGAQLLNQVAQRHPGTLRFITASFADKDLILACVLGTHQFIPKPRETTTLIAALQRGLALGERLANDNLKGLVSQLGNFPVLPANYFAVLKQLDSPRASMEGVGEASAKDPAMTAKLLQMVNSAFFGLPQKITNPAEAVGVLGVDTVRSIVLCLQVFTHYDKVGAHNFSLDRLWAHSLNVATAAKRIMLAETGDPQAADEAFTAGLLHDIGKLVLACQLREKYDSAVETARQNQTPVWEIEPATFGASHAEVGAYLLGLWGLPMSLLEATAFHHCPVQSTSKEFSPLTAVHLANAFASEQATESDGTPPPAIDLNYVQQLGLADRLDAWRDVALGKSASPTDGPTAKAQPQGNAASFKKPIRTPAAARKAPGFRPWLIVPAVGSVAAALIIWLIVSHGDSENTKAPDRNNPSSATAVHARKTSVGKLPSRTPDQTATSTNKPSATASAASATGENAFPYLKLQGIFYRENRASVIINGKTLAKGETVSGAKVVAIDRTSVTLEFAGQTKKLSFNR